jgi:hypothetical protein
MEERNDVPCMEERNDVPAYSSMYVHHQRVRIAEAVFF